MSGLDEHNDQELEAYLRGDSEISRRYHAVADEQPPAELDHMVMAQARAAERNEWRDSKSFPRHSRAQWGAPFAAAAMVLVSLALFRNASVHPEREAVQAEESGEVIVSVATSFDMPADEVRQSRSASPTGPIAAIMSAKSSAMEQERLRKADVDPLRRHGGAQADAGLSAEQLWLETIRKLRVEGKDEDADALLQRFLKVYPDYFERHPDVKRP